MKYTLEILTNVQIWNDPVGLTGCLELAGTELAVWKVIFRGKKKRLIFNIVKY